MQCTAFEITEEDVACVLASNPICPIAADGRPISELAEACLTRLDFAKIEDAALMGDDISEQTDYAHDEITKQLKEMGVLQ